MTWEIVPTQRRTSRADMVDVIFRDGNAIRPVANYVTRENGEKIVQVPYLLSLVEKQAQTIQAIRELCLDPKEKDGCQTVASQVVRLCDEALEGK